MSDERDEARSREDEKNAAERTQKAGLPRDRLVDEAEEESFPASDPPESYQID